MLIKELCLLGDFRERTSLVLSISSSLTISDYNIPLQIGSREPNKYLKRNFFLIKSNKIIDFAGFPLVLSHYDTLVPGFAHIMKLKESGSWSDSERLNFLENTENAPTIEPVQINLSDIKTPFKEAEMSVLSLGSPRLSESDPANHDKIYYDDRFNESAFDTFLARNSLPKILISIGGMLLTGFFLNIIIVSL